MPPRCARAIDNADISKNLNNLFASARNIFVPSSESLNYPERQAVNEEEHTTALITPIK